MQATLTSFDALGLSEPLLRNLTAAGFLQPTPIQAEAVPPALTGRDVVGCAQTGTGKTGAFLIPMIERLTGKLPRQPRGLILAPTRELAIQIQGTIDKLGHDSQIFATTIIGGADMQAQVRGLQQQPDILVATPGRLLDHMWSGTVNLALIEILVLDEADRMLDMGFALQINQILDALPEERQTLLYSATMPDDLTALAQAGMKDPVKVMVTPSATTAAGVTQAVHHTTYRHKPSLIVSLLQHEQETVLVFTRTKHGAERLGSVLSEAGYNVAVLHGDRNLSERKRALEGFKRGTFRILVATDIAARGIDVKNIGHVINYDLPTCPEDYVHRIGRTARIGATGRATSFITPQDHEQMQAIERLLGQSIPLATESPAPHERSPRHEGRSQPRSGQRRPQRHRPAGSHEQHDNRSHGSAQSSHAE